MIEYPLNVVCAVPGELSAAVRGLESPQVVFAGGQVCVVRRGIIGYGLANLAAHSLDLFERNWPARKVVRAHVAVPKLDSSGKRNWRRKFLASFARLGQDLPESVCGTHFSLTGLVEDRKELWKRDFRALAYCSALVPKVRRTETLTRRRT